MKRLGLFLLLVALPTAQAHAAGWRSAGTIGVSQVAAAIDRSGNALFAYAPDFANDGLFVRARPRGGPLEPRETLTNAHAGAPQLAGNGSGEAVLSWQGTDANRGTVREMAALRSAGKGFGAPQTLLGPPEVSYTCEDTTAISTSGYAVVVFTAGTPGSGCVPYASVRLPGSDHFEAPVALSTNGAEGPQVAFDDSGNALIAWRDLNGPAIRVVRYLPQSGGFQAPQDLAIEGERADTPAFGPILLRVSPPTGAAIIAFPSSGSSGIHVAAAIGSAQNGFGQVSSLSGPTSLNNRQYRRFDAAAGADGTLALAWRGGLRQEREVQVARVGPGADSITALDTNSISDLHVAEVTLAISDDGRVTVAWARLIAHGKRTAVEAATCAPSKHCGRPQRLSSGGYNRGARPDAATSSTGVQFVTWFTGSALEFATAPRATGRFGKAHGLARATGVLFTRMYRGRRGAMLATVEGAPATRLFAYNEH